MSIFNFPLLLVFYSLLGWGVKTPERPLVNFFFGSLKQTVYFCRLVCSSHVKQHHHPSVAFFLNCLSTPFSSFWVSPCPYFSGLHLLNVLNFMLFPPKLGSAGLSLLCLCFSALTFSAWLLWADPRSQSSRECHWFYWLLSSYRNLIGWKSLQNVFWRSDLYIFNKSSKLDFFIMRFLYI